MRVSLGITTCEVFLYFVAIVRVRAIMLISLFSLFYVTGEFDRFLHRGRAKNAGRDFKNSVLVFRRHVNQSCECILGFHVT